MHGDKGMGIESKGRGRKGKVGGSAGVLEKGECRSRWRSTGGRGGPEQPGKNMDMRRCWYGPPENITV